MSSARTGGRSMTPTVRSTPRARTGSESVMRLIQSSCVEVRNSNFHKKSVARSTASTSARLVARKKSMVRRTLKKTPRPSSTARTMAEKLSSPSTMSAAFLVTSVPEPIATPISAAFTEGASLTPSPVMATTSPSFCSALTMASLCLGLTRANTRQRPIAWAFSPEASSSSPVMTSSREDAIESSFATASAVAGLSPVIITVRTPARLHASTASFTPSRGGSKSAASPRKSSFVSSAPSAKARTRIARSS